MYIRMRQLRWHEKFHGIPWNLKFANFVDTSSSMEFDGIPWNLECANFADTSSSMEFHGTCSAPISLTRAVPWNCMELAMSQFRWHEQLHGIPWNFIGLQVRQFRWHDKFNGIPWNLECAIFADTSSSMEFHGTRNAPISMTRAVPWNSMKLRMHQLRWHEQFYGIPWNSMELLMSAKLAHRKFHGIPWNSMELLVSA